MALSISPELHEGRRLLLTGDAAGSIQIWDVKEWDELQAASLPPLLTDLQPQSDTASEDTTPEIPLLMMWQSVHYPPLAYLPSCLSCVLPNLGALWVRRAHDFGCPVVSVAIILRPSACAGGPLVLSAGVDADVTLWTVDGAQVGVFRGESTIRPR
jgi:hypothetical protein